MLVLERRSANGAFGRHERQDSDGIRLVIAASRWRSSVRRSMSRVVRLMPGRERGADRRREQQGHSPGLALVPSGYQAFGVREHLRVGRTSGGDLSVRLGLPLSFHLSAVEAHDRIVA
jgi:hypothetical protein